jgi:hypothetical protein
MTPDTIEITWVAERAPDVPEPDGLATEQARVALMQDISAVTARPRRRWVPWAVAAASASAIAAAGVVVLSANAGHHARPGVHVASVKTTQIAHVPVHHVVAGTPVLLRLAHSVSHDAALPGNATLVVHQNVVHGGQPHTFTGEDLYEDNGDYYFGQDRSELLAAVADPAAADATEGKVIAAAAASADVSPAQAAQNIYAASPAPAPGDPGTQAQDRRTIIEKLQAVLHSAPAAQQAAIRRKLDEVENAPDTDTVTQSQRDNYLWMNISTAFEGGAGRSDVRAGALLAASQLPDVTVTQTTFDGQPVVEVTNSEFSDNYSETYDLDPQTGVLVHFRGEGGTDAGDDSVDITYQVSRVTTPGLDPAH